jgi:predicted ArsR family transcriptional regulator
MQNTRQQIIDYLKSQRTATVAALSLALEMTRPNIRHHLALLREQGLVKIAGQQADGGRGRPTLVYMLASVANQDGLIQLVRALLDEINAEKYEKSRAEKLKRLAQQLFGQELSSDSPITIRLNQSMQRLNELHYQAHWEAHADGPQIILGQCPYAAIIQQHPELCQLDTFLVETMTGRPARQVEKMAPHPEGPHTCRFLIG